MKPLASILILCENISDMLPLKYVPLVSWPRIIKRRLRRQYEALCLALQCGGEHRITRESWIEAETGRVAEIHAGCGKCTLYWLETPDGRQKTQPKFWFIQ